MHKTTDACERSRPRQQPRDGGLSAAAVLQQASGSGWLPAYVPRAAHGDAALAALRARTGDAAFNQAWDRGQAADGAAVQQAVAPGRAQP